ncbi:MAG TPA: transposase domain-containing protein [Victivallales bacterium]|nr:transposase domain-containing protein [Victivallales bacterium]
MYLGSRGSRKAMANHMTLVQCCRAMNINPQKYLEYIYRNLMSYPDKQLHELLVDRWKETQT